MIGSGSFSGVIADGGIAGGTGGSLIKVGSGTLTLSGINLLHRPDLGARRYLKRRRLDCLLVCTCGAWWHAGGTGTVGATRSIAGARSHPVRAARPAP